MGPRSELVMLLEERTLPHFERRRRRLQQIPGPVRLSAIRKAWEARHTQEKPLRVTREEWIVLHLGWVPEGT